MFVSCEGEEGVSTIHQVAGDERVGIRDGRQGVGSRARNEADHKEDLAKRYSGLTQIQEALGLLLPLTSQTWLSECEGPELHVLGYGLSSSPAPRKELRESTWAAGCLVQMKCGISAESHHKKAMRQILSQQHNTRPARINTVAMS